MTRQDPEENAAAGGRSKDIAAVKKKMNLPVWKDLSDELHVLAERNGAGWADELKEKVDLYRRFVEYQSVLMVNIKAMGVDQANAMRNMMDLQMKLFELEQKLRDEGTNPLESPEWVKAREMLAKEMQFIHKHKLDIAQFQASVEKAKTRLDDDSMFVVEAEVIEEE